MDTEKTQAVDADLTAELRSGELHAASITVEELARVEEENLAADRASEAAPEILAEGNSSTHPAGAVTRMPDGRIRQHGDPNPDLNSAPSTEPGELQAGDLSPEERRRIESTVTDTATDVKSDRADIGTE